MRRSIVLFSTMVGLTGCVHVNATRLDNRYYAPVQPREVAVYADVHDVPQRCRKLALLFAKGNSGYTNEADMIEKGREIAGEMGGDAILVGQIDEPSAGAKVAGAVLGTGAERQGRMTALRCRK